VQFLKQASHQLRAYIHTPKAQAELRTIIMYIDGRELFRRLKDPFKKLASAKANKH
jgi:meiotically up-regulated gene 157 (Mug157) protein